MSTYSTGSSTVRSRGCVSNHGVLVKSYSDICCSKTEIVNSPPLSQLPKNVLKAPAHNPTDPSASPAYSALPTPSAAHPLRHPEQRFLDSEAFTNKFSSHVSGPMEKVTRRTMKRWAGAYNVAMFCDVFVNACHSRARDGPCGLGRRLERLQPSRKWSSGSIYRENWTGNRRDVHFDHTARE